MAYILIDGYNLIGIGHNKLETARNDIIEKLSRYSKIRDHDITIVFDAWKAGQSVENRTKSGRVTVIYSRVAEKADDVIISMIGKDDKAWIVVSTDREIYDAAIRKELAAITSEEFERKLYQSLNEEMPEETEFYDDDDEEPYPAYSKGNPRKLSKKDKKRLQAINKL
jgi:predicted RNA-binding protein with PIN domain